MPLINISFPAQPLSFTFSRLLHIFEEGIIPANVLDWIAYLLWAITELVILAGVAVYVHPRNREVVKTFLNLAVTDTEITGSSSRQVKPGGCGTPKLSPQLSMQIFASTPVLPFAVFILVYLVFMVAIAHQHVGKGINSRYVMPIYAPLMFRGRFC